MANLLKSLAQYTNSLFLLNIEKNNQHTIAVHFVDFLSPLPPYHLKSEERLRYFVSITSPEFITEHFSYYMQERFYRTMLLSVNAILCLLFGYWLFKIRSKKPFANRGNYNNSYLLLYCETYSSPGVSFFVLRFFALVAPILRAIVMTLIIVLMLRIFKRKITTLF